MRLLWRLQGKPSDLPSDLTEWDVRCLSLYARGWTFDQVRSVPLRHWRYLPTLWAAVAEMQNQDRPGT